MRPVKEFERAVALVRDGLNDRQVAHRLGIPRRTVRDWRVKALGGWSPGGRGGHDCPVCGGANMPFGAYAYLLGLYLGDGCISPGPRGVFRLRISCCDQYPGIVEECKRAISAVRPSWRGMPGVVVAQGVLVVSAYWKHWPCVFPQHGPGRKHLRRIELVSWQDEIVAAHPDRLLRGLIHSDGYRGLNWVNGKGYPRYQFTNESEDIRAIFCQACDAYGVRWRVMRRNTISLARAPDVAKLDRVVGPKQ